MKDGIQISVRRIDPQLHKRMKMYSKLKDKSLNDAALEALREKFGDPKTDKKREPSWKKFVGSFDDGAFDDSVFEDMERVDPEMWK